MSNRRTRREQKLLLDILSISRPHNTEAEVQFCKDYLDRIDGMQRDAFGNRYLRIGTAPVLWSCHVDTVAHVSNAGPQAVTIDADGFARLVEQTPKRSLGADDGVGVWIMLLMIAANRPGLYVFHRGEEVGCLGSTFIRKETPELLDGIQWAIAFDRQGTDSVITWQAAGMTASDGFARSIARHLNKVEPTFAYRPDDGGIYTDTNEYAHLIPECSNLSVGYYGQHTCREELDVLHSFRLKDAMLKLDVAYLVVEREAGDCGVQGYYMDRFEREDTAPPAAANDDWLSNLVQAVKDNPKGAAWLLYQAGQDAFDVIEAEDEMGQFIGDPLAGDDCPFEDEEDPYVSLS